jgi:hypothetical protein
MPGKCTRLGKWRYNAMLNVLPSVLSPDTVSQMDSGHFENQTERPDSAAEEEHGQTLLVRCTRSAIASKQRKFIIPHLF